jgi:predicted protein tyrosine phosphatase
MAIRRVCAKFGIARNLWDKDDPLDNQMESKEATSKLNNVSPIKNPNCKVIGQPKFG